MTCTWCARRCPRSRGGARDWSGGDRAQGTNNVFTPTRAGHVVVAHWPAEQLEWNNYPDDWAGEPGDHGWYLSHSYVSEIRVRAPALLLVVRGVRIARARAQVSPHNEPNDLMYMDTYDQPDGCPTYLGTTDSCHEFWTETPLVPPTEAAPDPGVLQTQTCRVR